MLRFGSSCALFGVALWLGCGGAPGAGASDQDAGAEGGGDATTPVSTSALPCDVDDVLARRCRQCHGASPSFGAPNSLVTYDDLTQPSRSDASKPVYTVVGARVHAAKSPMPPLPDVPLDTTDLSAIDGWIATGAPPAKDGQCAASPPDASSYDGGVVNPLSCTPDVHMSPASKWNMPQTTDDEYVCYGFDVAVQKKRHLIGIAPLIDNRKIVHHLVLFQSDTAMSSTPQPCSLSGSTKWRIVYGWAPGGSTFEFPPEAGYPEVGSTHYVVQIHYNNIAHAAGESDGSGFDFCTTDQLRPNDADSFVLGTTDFAIPAHGALDITCAFNVPAGLPPIHLFSSLPHMHQLGAAISSVELPGGTGTPVDLGAQPKWDFQSQVYYKINATVGGGDVIKTRCAWNNPTDRVVSFGPNTEDEMCFSYTMYYPRITVPQWNAMAPVYYSTCSATP